MYWLEIGVSADLVYRHTYTFNRIYRRPVFPLGPDSRLPAPDPRSCRVIGDKLLPAAHAA